MKTLSLILILALSVNAQGLISADGAEWCYIATGKDKDGAKFNVFARRTKADKYPTLEVKFADDEVMEAEHDCKAKAYRLKGASRWEKSPRGSVGESLVKFACKK